MAATSASWRRETRSVHSPDGPDPATHVVLRCRSTSRWPTASTAPPRGRSVGPEGIKNPTNEVMEEQVPALEGCVAALTSGQAAVTYAILNVAEAGDNIVNSCALHGGGGNLFAHGPLQFDINRVLPSIANRPASSPR